MSKFSTAIEILELVALMLILGSISPRPAPFWFAGVLVLIAFLLVVVPWVFP